MVKNLHFQPAAAGGEEAEVSEFPWAALLHLRSSETNQTSRCGGSLISNKHVLTAGHCLREGFIISILLVFNKGQKRVLT